MGWGRAGEGRTGRERGLVGLGEDSADLLVVQVSLSEVWMSQGLMLPLFESGSTPAQITV